MRWSFAIGRIAGIKLQIHVTFLLLLAAVPLFMASDVRDAVQVTLVLLSLFACVVLHELGHALAARRYGIATREIVLLPIGGLARLERMPEKPSQELVVALAGPLVNVGIAGLLAGGLALAGRDLVEVVMHSGEGYFEFLLAANITMIVFNLVPAFPMDGGRVLRALLAMRMPFVRATRIASVVGQAFALLFAVLGVFVLKSPTLVFIALFVFMAAGEERALVQTRTSVSGVPVASAMVTQFDTLDTRDELKRAVALLMAGSQQDFPVLEDGRLLGMLSRADLVRALRQEGDEAPVGRVARLDVEPVDASALLENTIARMREQAAGALPVTSHGRLVGVLTLENVAEYLLVQEARQRRMGRA